MRLAAIVLLIGFAFPIALRGEEKLSRALQAAKDNRGQEAVELLSDVITEQPALAEAYYWRGRERFRLGWVEKSLADFDKYVELEPRAASRQWERGIACYYAQKYEAGAKQFELYQTYHDQDVENSVWRYLCVVPTDGVDKARENMLPIKNDSRVPMMEIYDLFRGKKSPNDVLAAAEAGQPCEEALKTRMFYAHLYVGLYYESLGKRDTAKPHIVAAASNYRIGHYMGDVARIHAERLRKPAEEK